MDQNINARLDGASNSEFAAMLQAQGLNRIADALEALQAHLMSLGIPAPSTGAQLTPEPLQEASSAPQPPSWITNRCPTAADARPDNRSVIIPVADGTTVATIDWNLVVDGQPWAHVNTNPGPWPF